MSKEGILGIPNRTENWKTVRYFKPFIDDESLRLALAKRLGAPDHTKAEDVRIELFWKGMRDHLHKLEEDLGRKGKQIRLSTYFGELADFYPLFFGNLRGEIKKFEGNDLRFQKLNKRNYNHKIDQEEFAKGLGTNLVNTEVDVVLETPDKIFIGEAKAESMLDGTSSRILVHQLIRQYVMCIILTEDRNKRDLSLTKEIVPFVVRKEPKGKEQLQIEFMKAKSWLKKRNILSWDCFKDIAEGNRGQ